MKSLTIYLSNETTVVDFMLKTTQDKLSTRYRMTHLAEDMKVNYLTLYRFMNGKNVSQDFYIRWFEFFVN